MNCKTWRDSVSNEGRIPLLIESRMAPLSNTVPANYFSIALIRYMTKSDVGRTLFCLGFHHCRELVWERWQQAGGTVSGSGSWELTPQPQAQREQTGSGGWARNSQNITPSSTSIRNKCLGSKCLILWGTFQTTAPRHQDPSGSISFPAMWTSRGVKKGQPFGANWITGK